MQITQDQQPGNNSPQRERKQDYDRKSPEGFLLNMDGQSGEEKQRD